MRIVASIVICVFLMVPVSASAQGLVPQCGAECNTCHLVELVNNVVQYLIAILSILAVIVMVIAGFKMVTSAGNQKAWDDGKSLFTNVIIGIVIVLAAWLIVDTVLEVLTGNGLDMWTADLCAAGATASLGSSSQQASNQTNNQSPVSGNGINDSTARAQLAEAGISVWESAPGRTSLEGMNQATLDEALYLRSACNCPVTVTGGTESGHAAGTYSHSNGYKIDLDDSPALTSYIKSQGVITGTRSDGAQLYSISSRPNAQYALEGNHWDITVR